MNIKAYRLYDQAVAMQPTPLVRGGSEEDRSRANQHSYDLLCSVAFTATWNGGPHPEDIKIRLVGANLDEISPEAASGIAFVQSQLGGGLLTFYPGYQFKTASEYALWLRGPLNLPKDGLYPLEQIVDTALLPATVTVQWQFTRPHQTVHFAAGEPFARLLLYPKSSLDALQVEVEQPAEDATAYEQAFQQMANSPALTDLMLRLATTSAEPTQATPIQTAPPQPVRHSWAAQIIDPPGVSCICPTYGRVKLLEEAIESFLRQDYPGPKELIVLNDYAQQTLAFDHPDVRIINLPKRFHSVGEMYKAAVALASHDLIFVWHDDDIYLPHRLSYSVAHCDQDTAFFKANQAWFWNQGKLSGPEQNLFHGGSCWRRTLFSQVQGYPHIDNHYDREFEQLCQAENPSAIQVDQIEPNDIYYIYRWGGTGSYHLSALGANGQAQQNVTVYIAQQAASGQIPQGPIQLKPHWQSDYLALVQAWLATLPPPLPKTCLDTVDGRVDLTQFEPDFFFPERFFGQPSEGHLKRYGEIYGRDFYIVDALKLVYLSVPKAACTAIKLALAKAMGIEFGPDEDRELAIHHHPQWGWAQNHLPKKQSGYYRFTFVRNPFERLVSCYRQKIRATALAAGQAPLFHNYFFAMPANCSFADFAQRVNRIPDALADSHFKSQYALLYRGKERQVDYIGKLEQLAADWQPLAEQYQLDPLLVQANVSKNNPGCHSDYRLYYTEALVHLVYERYCKDIHTFGYVEEYQQLLAFVREQTQTAAAAISE